MGIREILEKYDRKEEIIEERKQEEEVKLFAERKQAADFIERTISPAFSKLKDEFDTYGRSHKAVVEIKPKSFYACITIYHEDIKEFYYELNLGFNENDFWVKLVSHHIKGNGTLNYLPEENMRFGKPLAEVSEEDIRRDFYQRYDQVQLLRSQRI